MAYIDGKKILFSPIVNIKNVMNAKLDEKTITENGTYNAVDEDLDGYSKVVVNVPSSGGSGGFIDVTELPTEDINKDAIYRLTKEELFTELVEVSDSQSIPYIQLLTAYGAVATANTIPTKTTDNIKIFGDEYHFYYIEDENDVFVYDGEDWISVGEVFGGLTYNGAITDVSEATEDGYYTVGSGTTIHYYQYNNRDASFVDLIAYEDGSVQSLGSELAGLYYAKTRPAANIKDSSYYYGLCPYYIEDENNVFFYYDGAWISLIEFIGDSDNTFNGAITDSSQAIEDGYYAVIREASSGFEELIYRNDITAEEQTVTPDDEAQNVTPKRANYLSKVTVEPIPEKYIIPSGTLTMTENNTYDVKKYASAKVSMPTTYKGLSLDDIPTNAVAGSIAIIWEEKE